MIKIITRTFSVLIFFFLANYSYADFNSAKEKKRETRMEKKVNEIYQIETSTINTYPNAQDFHDRYGEYIKGLILKQQKIIWADALSAFGAGMQGKTANQNAFATVTLKNERKKIYDDWINENKFKKEYIPTEKTISTGTGFAIAPNGLIVTNNHVVADSKEIKVSGLNGNFIKDYLAKVVIVDKNNDLAIIQITDNTFNNFGEIPYKIKQSSSMVGEDIFVLGYPLTATMGDEIKLTNGIISSKTGYQNDITVYQISAPVQPGNSGGPLFDKSGNLIGIVNAKHIDAENATYAIKVSYLSNLLEVLDVYPVNNIGSNLDEKSLSEQVSIIKDFVFLIKINY
jgi:S1-C subfamily serine protease